MNWEGFLMGVSDFTGERLKEERQKKMAAELEELRQKHAVAAEERAESRALKRVDNQQTMENFDPTTGTGTVRKHNVAGDLLSESAMSAGRIAEIRANEEKARLDNANTQSQIDSRKETLGIQRENLSIDRERNAISRAGIQGVANPEPRSDNQIAESLANDLVVSYSPADIRLDGAEGPQNMATIRGLARQAAWSALRAGDVSLAPDMFDRAVRSTTGFKSRNIDDL